jgi:glycosyltransferase involved in cell wall biosynthesis
MINKAISKPTVTIVTPLYNSRGFVRDTLDSVLKQTMSCWEIILVDDGSTDDTAAIVAPYLSDKRFSYIRQQNLGIAEARNSGLRVARGEWICLLDHDDHWLPTKLEKQLRYAQAHRCDIVCTDALIVEGTHRWVYSEAFPEVPKKIEQGMNDSRVDVFGILIKQNFICTCSVMIRKSMFDKYGLLDPTAVPADDFEMWLRCMPGAKIGFLNEPLVEYFRGENNYSNNEIRMLEKIVEVLKKKSRSYADDETRSRQFNESLALEYEILFRKLIDARAYRPMLKHACSLLGFRVFYQLYVAPVFRRIRNSTSYRGRPNRRTTP